MSKRRRTAEIIPNDERIENYDEALFLVFTRLPIVDRLRVQRVCKRWKAVGQRPWTDVKVLGCAVPWTSPGESKIIVTIPKLEQVLKFCGPFVEELDFSYGHYYWNCQQFDTDVDESLFAVFGKYCPNIRKIDMYHIMEKPDGMRYLAHYFDKLTEFKFNDEDYNYIDELGYFFERTKSLKSIKMLGPADHRWIVRLPVDTLETLIMPRPNSFVAAELPDVIEECHQLHTLHFTLDEYSSKDDLEEILEALTYKEEFKELGLSFDDCNFEIRMDMYIIKFKNLHTLDLDVGDNVDDTFLKNVAKHCQLLVSASFVGSKKITDHGLAYFRKLTQLHVGRLPNIKGNCFKKMTELSKLSIYLCENVKIANLNVVLDNAKNLRLLKIKKFQRIGYLIRRALAIIEEREKTSNTIPLTIGVQTKGKIRPFYYKNLLFKNLDDLE